LAWGSELMQLVRLTLNGFRRFKDADAQLHGRLMALVGPNEAGKSSVLDALEQLNTNDRLAPADLSHEQAYADDHPVVRARFLLEKSDRRTIAQLPGGASARWFVVVKLVNGVLASTVEPSLELDLRERKLAAVAIRRLAATNWGVALPKDTDDDLGSQVDRLAEDLDGEQVLPTVTRELLQTVADALTAAGKAPKSAAKLATQLADLVSHEPTEHPHAEAGRILLARRPLFLKFTQAHRDLQYSYELNGMDLDQPPVALSNVAQLAGLNLRQILLAVQAGDYAAPERPIEEANRQLASFFKRSWTQSGIAVRLGHHETRLHILITSPTGPYTSIRERSDGLRAFVALATFAEVHGYGDRDLVLLIDEAETHLHYDAQADLVKVLDLQQAATSVIYTTHSAGCLPEDLGASVRVVVREDDEWSAVQNAFWTKGVGFDPLLLGMGASALVFGAVRKAVIAEGATDLIVLPSLLREANQLTALGYQIAPGVAEASIDAIAELELQAAKAAYVVDDDVGGRAHVAKLRASGIDPARIFILGAGIESGLAVEDLIRHDLYVATVNEELRRSGRPLEIKGSDIPAKGRSAAVRKWCDRHGYTEPKKVNVATAIALDSRVNAPILTAIGRRVLKDLHSRLVGYLDV
jgi:hypothetical protein